jgi:acetylornithine deacetylase
MLVSIGNGNEPSLILSGHLDVVSTEGQTWNSDPYKLIQKDNKVFGRGTCDMKGFTACVLSILNKISINELKRPIFLVLTYDEETYCKSVIEVIDFLKTKLIFPTQCIVGEPTEMFVCDRHKCCNDFKIVANGKAAHASNPASGINAIYPVMKLCEKLQEYFDKRKIVFNIGTINGGLGVSIVPEYCEAMVEYRAIENLDDEIFRIADEFKLDYPQVKLEVRVEALLPHLASRKDNLLRNMCVRALDGGDELVKEFPAGTEAGFYNAVGIETVVCGPGSLSQAHKPDEFVSVSQLEKCEDFLIRLNE